MWFAKVINKGNLSSNEVFKSTRLHIEHMNHKLIKQYTCGLSCIKKTIVAEKMRKNTSSPAFVSPVKANDAQTPASAEAGSSADVSSQ